MEASRLRVAPRAGDGAGLTIEQLAADTGMSVRNIRAHQSRGLLPPPEVRARTGYYGSEHAARLRLIQEMQADGFNLSAIGRLLGDSPGTAEQLLGFKRIATAPFDEEEPDIVTAADLTARFPGDADNKGREKAVRLGVLVPLGGDRFEIPSPSLFDAAEEVMRQGVTLRSALEIVEEIKKACEAVSRRFVKLALDEVWKPYAAAGYPAKDLPRVTEAIARLRPLASQAMLAVFRQTMTSEVEQAFGKELYKRSKKS